jgi:cytochrome oxidase Cu insertion factor (SCO1/SenC/PrrC family)
MKIYILFIFLLGLSIIVLLGFISSGSEIKIGSKAPKFSLLDQDGNNFSLEKYKGKKLVIYFFPRASTPG